jgi:hypothetical protein
VPSGPSPSLLIGRKDGRMYVTSPQDNAVKVRDLANNGAGLTTLLAPSVRSVSISGTTVAVAQPVRASVGRL